MDDPTGEDYWRERAEQLQHALDSRIVVEQAKGILSERVGLEMDGAFSLLRYAARGAQMKIHALAQLVVDSDDTPEPVVRALARHASVLTRGARAERIVQTEIFFRAINEEIALLDGTATTLYLCECGNPACVEGISLPPGALEKLHLSPRHFVVLDGHEIPDVETVVDHADGYLIVRKNA
ncbi:MAG: ANTAR domain-containing protein [Gaiellaceae bacterium]